VCNEPHEFCMKCDQLMPLLQLSRHIVECRGSARKRYASTTMNYLILVMCALGTE